MPKLTKKANCLVRAYRRTDGQTDPNYRKASFLKNVFGVMHSLVQLLVQGNIAPLCFPESGGQNYGIINSTNTIYLYESISVLRWHIIVLVFIFYNE